MVRDSMSSLLWQNPWAWWLLLLLPVFFWKNPRRRAPARTLATLDGWELAPSAPSGWRQFSASALWPWITLLALITVLAAGPFGKKLPLEGTAPPIGVRQAAVQIVPGENGRELHWEALVVPPAEVAGFVVLADSDGVRQRERLPSSPPGTIRSVGGSLVLADEHVGPWTISWRGESGEQDPALAQATVRPTEVIPREVHIVAENEPWFLRQIFAARPGWSATWLQPEEWSPETSADAVIFLVPPTREIPADWLERNAAWFWGFGPGGRGDRQDFPVVLESDSLHPVTRALALDRVTVLEAFDPLPPESDEGWAGHTLAWGPSGPWLIAGEKGSPDSRGRWLASAFALDQSDLPLQTAFPVLLAQGLDWLTAPPPSAAVVRGAPPPDFRAFLRRYLADLQWIHPLLFLGALGLLFLRWPEGR
jgi:hypothetical protein